MAFNLSSKEFMFLCYAAGAKQMYGIEDGFKNVNTADMSSEIRKVHNSLEDKKYIDSDFSGNSTIDKQLLKQIQCCVNCSVLVLFNSSKKDYVKTVNYYFDADCAIRIVKNGDDYILEQFDKKLFADELFFNLSFKNGNEFVKSSETVILQKELEEIKKQLQSSQKSQAVDTLNLKFDKAIVSQLVSALEEKEDFYSVAVIDTVNSSKAFNSIMIIDTDAGALLLKPCMLELENAVKITACTRDEIKSLVKNLVCKAVQ